MRQSEGFGGDPHLQKQLGDRTGVLQRRRPSFSGQSHPQLGAVGVGLANCGRVRRSVMKFGVDFQYSVLIYVSAQFRKILKSASELLLKVEYSVSFRLVMHVEDRCRRLSAEAEEE